MTSIAYLLSIPLPMLDLSTLSVEHIKFPLISTCHLQYLMTKKTCILKHVYIYINTARYSIYIYIYYFSIHSGLPCQPQVCPKQMPSVNTFKRHPGLPRGFPPRCLCHLLASSKHLSSGNRSRTDSWCVQECRLIESSFFFVSVKIFFRKLVVLVKTSLYISTFKSYL